MTSGKGGYREAGVDLASADDALSRVKELVASTYTPGVLKGLGAFGGLFELPQGMQRPVLVASTDGVGTKTMVAARRRSYRGIGRDLVDHCINDILVQGARPLFFLDYVASSRLDPAITAEVVEGVAEACRANGTALLGGEMAEMPGVYAAGELDVVGTIVGIVERSAVIDGSTVRDGDVLLGLASGGLQTNGFSLARRVLDQALDEPFEDGTVADALLAPHRSFLPALAPLLEVPGLVHAMAHITGGGLPGNLPRSLPEGLGAAIAPGSWPVPPIFELIQQRGAIADEEMARVFNLGVGFVVVVPPERVDEARALCPEPLFPIGRVEPGAGVRFR
ncbi:MAG: phosphoribosylformylglycinamidine cyclo-ligase [Deinococcales bacterium]